MCRRGENIYHRKDGRWEGRFPIGKRENGTTRFKSVFGKTYLETRLKRNRALSEWLKENPSGTGVHSSLRFSTFAARWMEDEVMGTVKPSTYRTYSNTMKKQLLPFFSALSIEAITPSRVQEFIYYMEETGLSTSTQKSALGLLRSCMAYAQAEGYLRKNPCRKIRISMEHREQRVFSEAELRKIRESGDFPAILTMYTGLRLGEVCALRWSDINWRDGVLGVRFSAQRIQRNGRSKVIVSCPKTRKSVRVIPLPDRLIALLKAWQTDHGNGTYIFGKGDRAADPRTLQRRFAKLLTRLEISGGHFHTLRHSFATRLMRLGAEIKTVSALLGHSTTRTTMDFYVHSGMDLMKAAMESLIQSV